MKLGQSQIDFTMHIVLKQFYK